MTFPVTFQTLFRSIVTSGTRQECGLVKVNVLTVHEVLSEHVPPHSTTTKSLPSLSMMASLQMAGPAPHPNTISWILRACQESEQWAQEWSEYVAKLTSMTDQLRNNLRQLEAENSHLKECGIMQEQVIDTQQNLIESLKHDKRPDHEESNNPNTLSIDPTLPGCSPKSSGDLFEPPSCTSETYSAALLMALADSTSTGEDS